MGKIYWIYADNELAIMNLRLGMEAYGEEMPRLPPLKTVETLKEEFRRLPIIRVPQALAEYIDSCIRSGSSNWPVQFFIQEDEGPIREVKSLRPQAKPVKKAHAFAKKARAAKRQA